MQDWKTTEDMAGRQYSILRQCPLLQFHDRKLGDFIFTCLSLETFEELSKVFVLFMIVLSVTGLYMYWTLMTTDAGKLHNGFLDGLIV